MASNGYSALVGDGLQFAGVDQGIDFTGPGDVYTPYGGVVTRVVPGGSGWSGDGAVLVVKLLEGPAAGHYIYYAEDLQPQVRTGQKVKAGQTVARATGSGHAPGIEIGWATAAGLPLAPRPPARPAPQYTQEGDSFNRFIQAVGNVTHPAPGPDGFYPRGKDGQPVAPSPTGVHQIPGVDTVASIGDFLGRLTDPSYLLRGLQIIAGGGLVLVGVVLLARQVALAADLPDPVKAVGGAGAAKIGGAVPAAAVE